MLAFLALSVAVSTVSAQYGVPSNDRPSSYSSNPVYYPPAVYDSHYWDYSSRERHYKQCPKLTTFVGELPGIPDAAFYPPVIRYVKYGKRVHALVSCDRDPKNFNFLFARRSSSRDVRNTHLVAVGTTAGITLKCDRDERRYEGTVIDLKDTFPGDFSKQEEITQLTCMGLRETFLGLATELIVTHYSNEILEHMIEEGYLVNAPARKKREVSEAPAASTGAPIVEATTEAPKATEAVAETTKATVENTAAAASVDASTAAPESAAKELGDLLGKIFKP